MRHKVLIPLDRTDYSRQIIPEVKKFVPQSNTDLILLHVATPPKLEAVPIPEYRNKMASPEQIITGIVTPGEPRVYLDQLEANLRANIEDELHGEADRLVDEGYNVSIMVKFGKPADEILHAIEQEPINLVAMTTHAREGIRRLLFGSVAERVLHHVNIPVLLIHPSG